MSAAGSELPVCPVVAQPLNARALTVAARAAQDFADTRMITPLHPPSPPSSVPERDEAREFGKAMERRGKITVRNKRACAGCLGSGPETNQGPDLRVLTLAAAADN